MEELVCYHDLLRLADSYLGGAINVEGELEALFALKMHLIRLDLSLGTRLRPLGS